jgi:uncharacterized protein (DUF1778 family)
MARSKAPAKPKRRKAVRKDEVLQLRLTLEQKEALTKAASAEGLAVSSWLLSVGLKAARAVERATEE